MKQYAVQVSNMNTRAWDTVQVCKTMDEAKRVQKQWAPTYTRIITIMR